MRELTMRTWPRGQRRRGSWAPFGVVDRPCGCAWDNLADRMWEPCLMHEAEGHLSAVSVDPEHGLTVARCLVRECGWQTTQVSEYSVVLAAQDHWNDTRGAPPT